MQVQVASGGACRHGLFQLREACGCMGNDEPEDLVQVQVAPGRTVRLVPRLVCWSTACGGCTGRMCCVLERRGVSVCKQESVWGWLLININGVCVSW